MRENGKHVLGTVMVLISSPMEMYMWASISMASLTVMANINGSMEILILVCSAMA